MAPLFDTTKMSSDEFRFIRLYCSASRREYYAVSTAIALSDPDDLGVLCPFAATKLAIGLQGMYREFAHKIADVGAKHLPGKHVTEYTPTLVPSIDDVGQIFSISFFKLVDSATQSSIPTFIDKNRHDGWSSGRPSDWQHSLKSLYDIQKQKPGAYGLLGPDANKLFSVFLTYKFSNQKFPELEEYREEDEDDDYYDDEDYFK